MKKTLKEKVEESLQELYGALQKGSRCKVRAVLPGEENNEDRTDFYISKASIARMVAHFNEIEHENEVLKKQIEFYEKRLATMEKAMINVKAINTTNNYAPNATFGDHVTTSGNLSMQVETLNTQNINDIHNNDKVNL